MKKQTSKTQQTLSAYAHYDYHLIGSRATNIDIRHDTRLGTFTSLREAMAAGSARPDGGWMALAVATPWDDGLAACAVGFVRDGEVRWIRFKGFWPFD